MDHVHLGSSLSVLSSGRLGSASSAYDLTHIGPSLSLCGFAHRGSALTVTSHIHVGVNLSIFGFAHLGSSLSIRCVVWLGYALIFAQCVYFWGFSVNAKILAPWFLNGSSWSCAGREHRLCLIAMFRAPWLVSVCAPCYRFKVLGTGAHHCLL